MLYLHAPLPAARRLDLEPALMCIGVPLSRLELDALESLERLSPPAIVVRRGAECLVTGAAWGLRMLDFHSFSFSLLTILLTCDALNKLSFGGLPVEDAVGDLRRCRCAAVVDPGAAIEVRFRAFLICMASNFLDLRFSSLSEPELVALSIEDTSSAFCTFCKDERLPAVKGASSLNGDVSESDESCVIVGGSGEPSVLLARKPALNRPPLASGFSEVIVGG